jgi:hypothetical protein
VGAARSGDDLGVKIAGTAQVLGRLAVSVGCALAVVGIASRVNRPPRLAIVVETPRAADLVLANVRWDANSFRSAIESIQKAAPGVVVADWESLRDFDEPADLRYPRPVVRLRHVRVGTLLYLAVDPFRSSDPPEFVQEPGRVVVRGRNATAPRPVTTRIYDLRRIQGPVVPSSAVDAWDGYGEAMAESVREICYPFAQHEPGWRADGCGGWLLVSASDDGHRAVEAALLLIGRGDWPDDGEAGAR